MQDLLKLSSEGVLVLYLWLNALSRRAHSSLNSKEVVLIFQRSAKCYLQSHNCEIQRFCTGYHVSIQKEIDCRKTPTVMVTRGYALQQTHHRVTRKARCHTL